MDRPSTSKVEEYYNNLSASYDELYGVEQLRKHGKVGTFLENRIFGIVVDIGCGTGNLLEKFGDRYDAAIGIDVSLQMLRKARTRLGRGKVGFIRADSIALPMRSGSVDCVLTISLFDFSKDNWRAQMSELMRIAKNRGALAFTIFHSGLVPTPEQLGLSPGTRVENISRIETLYAVPPDSTTESREGRAA